MSTLWLCRKCGTRLSGVFLQDRIQRLDEQSGVAFGEDQRWAELNDVVMRAVGTGQDASVAQPVYDVVRFRGRRLAGIAVANEVDPEEQPGASDVADGGMALLQRL